MNLAFQIFHIYECFLLDIVNVLQLDRDCALYIYIFKITNGHILWCDCNQNCIEIQEYGLKQLAHLVDLASMK